MEHVKKRAPPGRRPPPPRAGEVDACSFTLSPRSIKHVSTVETTLTISLFPSPLRPKVLDVT